MICTILSTLPWLLITFTFSESLKLEVSSSIIAECGKPVILHCNISSSLSGLSIKYMEWIQSHSYCSVDSEGLVTSKNAEDYCLYDNGRLSLHFHKWSPYMSESFYTCKLHSNQGIKYKYTHVKTREQCESVLPEWVFSTPACTFRKVCPVAEVEWFHDSQRITDQSLITTERRVEAGGWFTIHSFLNMQDESKLYNCTLRSSSSGRYLASAVIRPLLPVRARAAALGSVWTSLWIFVIFEKYFLLGFV